MTSQQIYAYKELLEAKRAGLLRSLEETREQRDSSPQALLEQSRLLWIVEAALEGIAAGSYGKCLLCQRAISAKRMAEVPWSSYCASCQKLAEACVNRRAVGQAR
jgi:RNA polymerase-binding transcription factor DksA